MPTPNNKSVLDDAQAAVDEIEDRYQEANLADKVELEESRNQVLSAYSAKRLALLNDTVTCTEADVQEMQALREEVNQAAAVQALATVALKVATFLATL